MRIVKLLVGNTPKTVADLIEETGVTRTAVTEQLNELVAAGFVERETERLLGRGRPRHLYRATNAALLLLFTGSQRLVVPAIWRSISRLGGDAFLERVMKQVSKELADHYVARIVAQDPGERLRQMTDILQQEGGLAEVEETDGRVVLRKRSCAFISMVDEDRRVCCIDQEMMSRVVGRPVRRIACRFEGDPCCAFEIVEQ
jgi:predicted ArsR family transcriptional regulator